ncbi:MAG TPA: hypothetical protein DDZ80_24900 [Cyanobacteria bacterium UBA8803]|nr:hypothetical protein [Cyanobacteria bacterium UBA9273]HBL61542.1 hypothetical protein [Cyanobacteria bacterium UBA8803]
MPKLDVEVSPDPSFAELNSPASLEIKQIISQLQNSHDLLYKMINLESWALAETMDKFLPGFWSRFLANRQKAVKQMIQQKRSENY